MKKVFITVFGMIMAVIAYSQTVPPWTEDFDGAVSFTASPNGSWNFDTTYYLPGSSTTNPRAYLGIVPNRVGDSIILETPVYDCSLYEFVILKFNHICKVSPLDIARIEYRLSGSSWVNLNSQLVIYESSATNFRTTGFNAASYPEWLAEDSSVHPSLSQSWWREEVFNLQFAAGYDKVQFRFVLKHGLQIGTHASYGWLIDNFQLLASRDEPYPPLAEFVRPFVKDTVVGVGPYEINAKVKTKTSATIIPPSLIYVARYNGAVVGTDTLLMTHVQGDSLWKAIIPQYVGGTEVLYYIEGQDNAGNMATARSSYVIRETALCENGISGIGKDYVLQGNGGTSNVYPLLQNWEYARTMSLYTVTEIAPDAVGYITSVALRVREANPSSFPLKVYLKTVPTSKTMWNQTADNLNWADHTQDATLVYDGLFRFSQTDWVDIPFTTPFPYSRTENLVLMLEQNSGNGRPSSYASYYCSTNPALTTNMLIAKYNNTYIPDVVGTGSLGLSYERPDLRINVTPFCADANAVEVHAIDVPDTVFRNPNAEQSIVVTIKNKGVNDLTSATVYYSINGSSPKSVNWTSGLPLPWDFNAQDSIGAYIPTINGYDLITVWVEIPNGANDTLTKTVYGMTDIQAAFVNTPADTVYSTGPYQITAKIESLTGMTPPTVSLFVTSTSQNYTLNMSFDPTDNLWKAIIPNYPFGSDVAYSITLNDRLGNDVVLSKSYYIKEVGCMTATGSTRVPTEYFYTGSEQTAMLQAGTYKIESWGANGGASGGVGAASGGAGGYSVGTITLTAPTPVYINVGGAGLSRTTTTTVTTGRVPGGYNGGGASGFGTSVTQIVGSGGGATHIAKRTGLLSALSATAAQADIIIVAGGGGGAGGTTTPFDGITYNHSGGAGGGVTGEAGGSTVADVRKGGGGGTQTAGGAAGTGFTGTGTATTATAGAFGAGGTGGGSTDHPWIAGGGGGGRYGGGGGCLGGAGGGGGSGYVNTQLTDPLTAQISDADFIPNPITDGNGYVKITPVSVNTSGTCLDNSVALDAIDELDAGTVAADGVTSIPVHVTIRNMGINDLASCSLNWSLNGTTQRGTDLVYQPTPKLIEDFTDTITIGYYTPVLGQRDIIKVWVSMPNGVTDAYTGDDTLTVNPLGCPTSNIINIPNDFATVDLAIASLLACGINGKVVWEFEPGTYTKTGAPVIQFSETFGKLFTEKDTLVIRSTSGNQSDVIFKSASGYPAMRLYGIRNLYIEHVTIDASASATVSGVQMMSGSAYLYNNIEFNGCIIKASTSATSTSASGIYYSGTSACPSLVNIRILNNQISGGYSGIYLYYIHSSSTVLAVATTYGARITGNTIEDSYHSGIYSNYYGHFDSIAYNVVNTRNTSATQYGMYFYNYIRVEDGIIGNKITIRGTGTSYGIYFYNYINTSSTGASGPALVANNEIRRLVNGSTFYGLHHYYGIIDYIHNSVYGAGTGTNYGMYIYNSTTSYPTSIMNNLFICTGTNAGNLALSGNATPSIGITMDYNTFFSTGTNLGTSSPSLADLQTRTLQNANSVNIKPDFIDSSINLDVYSNIGITAPRTIVNQDIKGVSRLAFTTMGAYEFYPTGEDLMLLQIVPWKYDIVKGETVQVIVEAMNMGVPVTEATFGWSLNGVEQASNPATWIPSSPFISLAQQRIPIGSFVATGADTFNIVVWVKTVNGQADIVNRNDTVTDWAYLAPLADFTSPLVADTIDDLSFDVYVSIRDGGGLSFTSLPMNVYVESCNSTLRDTITVPMVKRDDKWVARVLQQYYGSKIIYEVQITDNIGNSVTLRDTTCIAFYDDGEIPRVIDFPYTGEMQAIILLKGVYELECWGAEGGGQAYQQPIGTDVGIGGKGGYSVGTISIPEKTTVYVYVGGHGVGGYTGSLIPGGFNGGGNAKGSGSLDPGASGGGASDIRIGIDSYYARAIVAGGGGGGGEDAGDFGGAGGGIAGTHGYLNTTVGATQTAPGALTNGGDVGFGQGANILMADGGGGGGGWYGGGRGSANDGIGADMQNGGGGSGWVYTQKNDSAGYTSSNYTGGTWLLNSNHYLTNAVTVDGTLIFPSPTGVMETGHSGHGFVRITTISGGVEDVYAGNNLAVFDELVSPVNTNIDVCVDTTSPVVIKLWNLGENNHDFTRNNVTISYGITNPRGTFYHGDTTLNTGNLASGKAMTVTLLSSMHLYAGSYTVKAWLRSATDNYSCDDTMNYIYTSDLLGLPMEEDFSGNVLSSQFEAIPLIGEEIWTPYTDAQISPPPVGGGMLRYVGDFGTMTQLSMPQLDLSEVVDPVLKFWYYHDSTVAKDRSYTDVNIIAGGKLTTAITLYRKDTATGFVGWKEYVINLKPFINGVCLMIQFETMNQYDTSSAQYLGHVTITSTPDLAVSEIIISPEVTLCDMEHKELKVVLRSITNQAIDIQGDSLIVGIGSQQTIAYPLTGTIAGSGIMMVPVATDVDLTNVTNIKAYLSNPVDNNSLNDTAKLQIDINPSLSITVNSLTGEIDCFPIGMPVQQQIYLKNTGNVDLPGIELMLRITGDNTMAFVKEIGSIDLQAGEDTLYTFVNTYIVPDEASYQIVVTAYLGCDSVKVHVSNDTNECADIDNLILSAGDLGGSIDTTGLTKTINVVIENKSETNSFTNIPVTALIEDKDRQVIETLTDTISVVNHHSTLPFSFTKKYTVPDDSIYYIKVYLGSVDLYPGDDTITITRNAIDTSATDDPGIGIALIKGTNVFTLSQNIPNPANNSTRIDYNVPEAGEVIFHVHSITGQLLYSKTIETERGTNSLELNTSTFAAGVYFYSMEYKGQRLVRQLIIK
ncbi:MAG: T9SS type A sorting domain-containing protein [Bacteroidales bacterium]|jgi:hypothetical protein|nr:T9SS type A sorting domain-containing protein [Bacteroidales bacterium]